MKNTKQARFVELSFLFLLICFLMLFSPCLCKAQSISTECGWMWKWVSVLENEYNGSTGRYELRSVYRYVYDCAPTLTQSSTNELAPSGEIQNIRVDYDVYDGQTQGMRIHIKFT